MLQVEHSSINQAKFWMLVQPLLLPLFYVLLLDAFLADTATDELSEPGIWQAASLLDCLSLVKGDYDSGKGSSDSSSA
jgi:hypothetical protein